MQHAVIQLDAVKYVIPNYSIIYNFKNFLLNLANIFVSWDLETGSLVPEMVITAPDFPT